MENLTSQQVQSLDRLFKNVRPTTPVGTKIKDIITAVNLNVGEKGPTGDKGATGDKGPTGDKGLQGDPGLQGLYTAITLGTPVNAVNAKETLTISGVVIDGETVTIGDDIYEFSADVALSVTAGNIPVNINASTGKATNGLTMDVNPTAGDTMTIGTKVFIFVRNGTANADGEIDIETLLTDTQTNVIAAIKGTDHNEPHPLVTCGAAFLANVLAVTALIGGSLGNNIATTETFTAGTNVFSAVTLQNGSDCSAANAVTALVTAITTSDTQGVGAADGDGDTVVLTADTAGEIGNNIVIGESMVNGSFTGGAVLLSGGIDGTIGTAREVRMDSSYLYLCIADNTTGGKNWRRISVGSAY